MPSKSRPLNVARILASLMPHSDCSAAMRSAARSRAPFSVSTTAYSKIGMKRQRAIVGQRPRRGRPDHCAYVARDFCSVAFSATHDSKFHPDGRAGVIFVFDFGFGKRGAVVEAPVHRLASAVDVPLFHEIQERAGDGGFVFVAHGQVGIVPSAENSPVDAFTATVSFAPSRLVPVDHMPSQFIRVVIPVANVDHRRVGRLLQNLVAAVLLGGSQKPDLNRF